MNIKLSVVVASPSFSVSGVPFAQASLFDGLLNLNSPGWRATNVAFSYSSADGMYPIPTTDNATRTGPEAGQIPALYFVSGSWPNGFNGSSSSGSFIDFSYGYDSAPTQMLSTGLVDISIIPASIDPSTLSSSYQCDISIPASGPNVSFTNVNTVVSSATCYTRALGAFNILGLASSIGHHNNVSGFTNTTTETLKSLIKVGNMDIDNPSSNFYNTRSLYLYTPDKAIYLSISGYLDTTITWPQTCATVEVTKDGVVSVSDNAMFNESSSFNGGLGLADNAGDVVLYNYSTLFTVDINNNPPVVDSGVTLPFLTNGFDTVYSMCGDDNAFFAAILNSSTFESTFCYSPNGIKNIQNVPVDYSSAPELEFIANGNFICPGIWSENSNILAYVSEILPGPKLGASYIVKLETTVSKTPRAVYPFHLLVPLPLGCIPLCEENKS